MEIKLTISVPLSDSFIADYRIEYFNPNFQEEDINYQILESVDLQRKIANDMVNSIRKEKPPELFTLLDPIYNEVENFDGSGLVEMSITSKDEVYEGILTQIESSFVTDLKTDEEFRKETAKEIFDATRNLEHT